MKNIRKESVYKYLNDIWNSQKKTKIKTFDEYLDYIKDKHCIIWCVETCSSVNDIDDRLQNSLIQIKNYKFLIKVSNIIMKQSII